MTGRLVGTADGRPVEIVAEGSRIRVALPGIFAGWRLRGSSAGVTSALSVLRTVGQGVTLSVGAIDLPVLPQPHPLVRWFGPLIP